MTTGAREDLLRRLSIDAVGPVSADEVFADRPSDRYLTGILFPQDTLVPEDEDESLSAVGQESADETGEGGAEAIPLGRAMRPAACGVSFALRGSRVVIVVSCGTYDPIWPPEEEEAGAGKGNRKKKRRPTGWRRLDHLVKRSETLGSDSGRREEALEGLPGLVLYLQWSRVQDVLAVTVALVNRNPRGEDPITSEQRTFFQVGVTVEPSHDTMLATRPSWRTPSDADGRVAELIYRDAKEYAVGHTCSAEWLLNKEAEATKLSTTWLPVTRVEGTSPDGDPAFDPVRTHPSLQPLSADWLAQEADPERLRAGLSLLIDAYATWIAAQEARIPSIARRLQPQAKVHIEICRTALSRMVSAVRLISESAVVRTSFRLAARAMTLQRRWATQGQEQDLRWRPFQLGFQLLSLASLADARHEDRAVMDLLWFPTGGGKTEAYLALIAFTLFHRRLHHAGTARGAGVGAFMRYTLRLLTIQQFERAAAMIVACEHLRRGAAVPPGIGTGSLGQEPFSIGLWVGGTATPKTVAEARSSTSASESNPRQLSVCPCCRSEKLMWGRPASKDSYGVECGNKSCEFGKLGAALPVWTVDEDVYRVRPSLVIGTIDKFAQIVRNVRTGVLFGLGTAHAPPDLILQDELHLISGPLGTVAAVYETAIDQLCQRDGVRPKIIGSTATIRRAEDQIRALFDRKTFQFPPPGLDAANSGFAVRDASAPGRLYAGVTTAGRSAKFALQSVCASLLQASSSISPSEKDWYWTQIVYFNALRELGGALALMMDDVGMSIDLFAQRRGELPRRIEQPLELTSRVTNIREALDALGRPYGDPSACDAVLASNMISVGVDVPRLGLMVVNGQPKAMAEYIQATSRVGRGKVPGLVVTIYNDNKPRDRSHYETFVTWHRTLYRDVEATSVTPFASRAQDRALHAVVVALARHLASASNPTLTPQVEAALGPLLSDVRARAERVDPSEKDAVQRKLAAILDQWRERDLAAYWDDSGKKPSLLISAEQHAALRAATGVGSEAWPTLNSMREVEPGTQFVLREALKAEETTDAPTE